ncbi:penicillin-binding protein activator [Acetobacteraceae bacterium KSS8]|uniref:Penicillin-binding protein activator n=1 Tax=Endosaccharibacter trunci TaxID=2812733 RepID=A0ABT1W6F3_9PROT|nr:penicillin-binding protein activator [Acetobacteraceae bacterium KSS8]
MASRQSLSRRGAILPALTAGVLLLGGCSQLPWGSESGSGAQPAPVVTGDAATVAPPIGQPVLPPPPVVPPGPKVGVLLPLSGPNGGLGSSMLRAARLAVAAPGSPVLDAHDTAAMGGDAAARAAVQSGDKMILGPLTSGETASVGPIARSAGIPVLAFTSDVNQAGPGVWVMGETPEQQVRRLVLAAKADNRTRIAALLPGNGFGDALAAALTKACADAGLPAPTILTHAADKDSIDSTMKQLTDYAARRAAADQSAAASGGTDKAPAPMLPTLAPIMKAPKPVVAAAPPMAPPPFDALLLGDTGLQLQYVISALNETGVDSAHVRIMGPGLWGAFASKLRALAGAWFAAPDPQVRVGFVQEYRAAYGQSPKPLADLAYDAAALARSLAASGYDTASLTRRDGFAGVDGVFALQQDGHVRRSLAIFQIGPNGGASMVQPPMGSTFTSGS